MDSMVDWEAAVREWITPNDERWLRFNGEQHTPTDVMIKGYARLMSTPTTIWVRSTRIPYCSCRRHCRRAGTLVQAGQRLATGTDNLCSAVQQMAAAAWLDAEAMLVDAGIIYIALSGGAACTDVWALSQQGPCCMHGWLCRSRSICVAPAQLLKALEGCSDTQIAGMPRPVSLCSTGCDAHYRRRYGLHVWPALEQLSNTRATKWRQQCANGYSLPCTAARGTIAAACGSLRKGE